jgi:ankyrin repeat protein
LLHDTCAHDSRFLLARLYVEALKEILTKKALRAALKDLPSGGDAYQRAYGDAISRIKSQARAMADLGLTLLAWLVCVKRPITTAELQHALAVEVNEPALDEDNVIEVSDMVSACAGLVTVDEGSGVIRLVHYTVQEYLQQLKAESPWLRDADDNITQVCVTYISFDIFGDGACDSAEVLNQRLATYPLYNYATATWAEHDRNASQLIAAAVLDFLQRTAHVQAAIQAATNSLARPVLELGTVSGSYSIDNLGGIDFAAYFGLDDHLEALLVRGLRERGSGKTSAFSPTSGGVTVCLAAERGHQSTTDILLKRGFDKDSQNSALETPLFIAARERHVEVAKILLQDGADPNIARKGGWTPVARAAAEGYADIVELLLDNGADASISSDGGWTPLACAAVRGYADIAQLLLAKDGIDPNVANLDGRTPLSLASEIRGEDYQRVVELLLAQKSIGADIKDMRGLTPLSYAAELGWEDVMERLLSKDDVDAGSTSALGESPLAISARSGRLKAVELLLRKDPALANLMDSQGRTPLMEAARRGHTSVVEALLTQAKIDPNRRARNGYTALHFAAANAKTTTVERLLAETNIDCNIMDEAGRTPLHHAINACSTPVVNLLLANCADFPATGRSSLHLASKVCFAPVVQALVDAGASVNSMDTDGQTPLLLAARVSHGTTLRILIEAGAEIEAKDPQGRTALAIAAAKGVPEAVKLLIDHNADIHSADYEGKTPADDAVVQAALERRRGVEGVAPTNEDSSLATEEKVPGLKAVIERVLNIGGSDDTEDTSTSEDQTPPSQSLEAIPA